MIGYVFFRKKSAKFCGKVKESKNPSKHSPDPDVDDLSIYYIAGKMFMNLIGIDRGCSGM